MASEGALALAGVVRFYQENAGREDIADGVLVLTDKPLSRYKMGLAKLARAGEVFLPDTVDASEFYAQMAEVGIKGSADWLWRRLLLKRVETSHNYVKTLVRYLPVGESTTGARKAKTIKVEPVAKVRRGPNQTESDV